VFESNTANSEDGGTFSELGVSELDSFEVESRHGLLFLSVPCARDSTLAGVAFVGVGGWLELLVFTAGFDSFGSSGDWL